MEITRQYGDCLNTDRLSAVDFPCILSFLCVERMLIASIHTQNHTHTTVYAWLELFRYFSAILHSHCAWASITANSIDNCLGNQTEQELEFFSFRQIKAAHGDGTNQPLAFSLPIETFTKKNMERELIFFCSSFNRPSPSCLTYRQIWPLIIHLVIDFEISIFFPCCLSIHLFIGARDYLFVFHVNLHE